MREEIEKEVRDEEKGGRRKGDGKGGVVNLYEMGLEKGDVVMWKDEG